MKNIPVEFKEVETVLEFYFLVDAKTIYLEKIVCFSIFVLYLSIVF